MERRLIDEGARALPVVLWSIVALFPVSEIALALRARSSRYAMQARDRGSMRLMWIVFTVAIFAAVLAESARAAAIHGAPSVVQALALGLLVTGLAIRWVAIVHLGRLFTVDVAVSDEHRVVDTGPYRLVRHPSYTGLMLAFLGLGVAFANWLSVIVLMVPVTLAVLHRVKGEEQVLRDALGDRYAAYCARTRRFVPGVF